MKLRNKNTGGIFNVAFHSSYKEEKITIGVEVEADPVSPKCNFGDYASLKEFCEVWEDAATKPLIKDEKICKAVRAWSEANEVAKVYVCSIGDGKEYLELYAQDNGVTYGMSRISIKTQDGLWIGKEYTIAELCGEEKW